MPHNAPTAIAALLLLAARAPAQADLGAALEEVRAGWGQALLDEQRFSEAREIFQALAEQDPRSSAAELGLLHAQAGLRLVDGRPAEALPLLEELAARGAAQPRLHVRALRELERLEAAEDLCRAWIAELQASGAGPVELGAARFALGELELARGRPAAALALFDAVAEEVPGGSPGPWVDRRALHRRAVVESFPFPVAATALHYLLMATIAGLAAVAVAGRAGRARPYLAAALALALLVAALELASIAAGPEELTLGSAGYVSAALVRNSLYAAAGLVLLPRAVARRGALLRALRGRPEPRRLLATLGWIAGAVALMWAVTRGMLEFAQPAQNEFCLRMARLMRESELSLLFDPWKDPLEFGLLVTTAAIQEELLFRFAMLGVFLAGLRRLAAPRRPAAAVAVLLAAVLFAVPHAGMVDPEWFKLVQVTLLGCVLGALCLRRGPGAAVLAHVAFNLSTLLVASGA